MQKKAFLPPAIENRSHPAGADIFTFPDLSLDVSVTYRYMKTMRLRVRSDGSVQLSVPYYTSKTYIRDFIISKQQWIGRIRERFARSRTDIHRLLPDSAATLAGFSLPVPSGAETAAAFEKKWRKAALEDYRKTVDRFFPLVRERTALVPDIRLRKMKSLWGSCNCKTGTLTFNTVLFRAPQRCIDYVVLHELTHYLYRNHDASFYAFIAQHMDDWKERQQYLNRTVCLL